MGSLKEFLALLESDPEKAMNEYVVENETRSLDGDVSRLQECAVRDVVFDFEAPNKVVIRAKGASETSDQSLWYLPWMWDGLSQGDLDGRGPPFFSTSQLTGCRFTIQYHDATRKKVTVMHIAGTLGTGTAKGTEARDKLESHAISGLESGAGPMDQALRRRYSFRLQKARKVADGMTGYYGGNMAWIFGSRDSEGRWTFVAQEIDEFRQALKGLGLKNLST